MDTKWTTQAQSGNSTPVELTEEMLNENVVILLQGKNVFGDKIFSYLELTLSALQELKAKMRTNDNFMPSDFGTVLAAGKGDPSDELRSEMAVTYNMIDVPGRKSQPSAPMPAMPTMPQVDSSQSALYGAPAQTATPAAPAPSPVQPPVTPPPAQVQTPQAMQQPAPAPQSHPAASTPAYVPEQPAPAETIKLGPFTIPKFW